MSWCELDALCRHQVEKRIVLRGQVLVNDPHDRFVVVRPGNREHVREGLTNPLGLGAETSGDNDPAILRKRFTDGIKRFFDRLVDARRVVEMRVDLRLHARRFDRGVPKGARNATKDDYRWVVMCLSASTGDVLWEDTTRRAGGRRTYTEFMFDSSHEDIGEIPEGARKLTMPGCWLHDYGKSPRDGRKLGHITVVAESAGERDEGLRKIEAEIAKV